MPLTESRVVFGSGHLPSGWKLERRTINAGIARFRRETAVVSCSAGGVTLDYLDRGWRWGWTTSGPLVNVTKFHGRGWRTKLEDAALEAFKALLDERVKRNAR